VTLRVLVADDAATVRTYFCSILTEAGFDVAQAVNGYDAFERALVEPFDLFLVDVNMPRLDGYSFVKLLRAEPETAARPVIMISTESSPADADRAYAAGANLYLVKPVDPAHLALVAGILAGDGSPT
jgi:two-component system, chemotaxis family, chemotaxis protein CheY